MFNQRNSWRRWHPAALLARAVIGSVLTIASATAQVLPTDNGPRLPCALEVPWPPYPEVGSTPIVRAWVIHDRYPLRCADWPDGSPVVAVALSARVQGQDAMTNILHRFAAVSSFASIRYWSVSRKRWDLLVTNAHAVSAPGGSSRADFDSAELTQGATVLFAQRDSHATADVTYKMSVLERHANRLIVSIVNQSPVSWHFLTLFQPQALRATWFITRESSDVWDVYYVMVAAGNYGGTARQTDSYINRAVAYYRYLVDIPTDREPAAAP